MSRWLYLAVAVVMAVGSSASAGEFNSVLKIGDAAPAWKDLPGVDGKTHSLSDVKTPIVVVAFTCNTCEYAKDYVQRMKDLTTKYGGDGKQVSLVAINVNTHPLDALPAMIEYSSAKEFNFPYLYDESQAIAKAYGAVWTPEFFVLDSNRKIIYMGAFDDHTDRDKVNNQWVDKAIVALLAGGSPEKTETPARGCAIKFNRERREKAKKE